MARGGNDKVGKKFSFFWRLVVSGKVVALYEVVEIKGMTKNLEALILFQFGHRG